MHKNKFSRVFVIVCDSLGVGASFDAAKFDDEGTDTLLHTSLVAGHLNVPTMNSFGLADINDATGLSKCPHPHSFASRLTEQSVSKDTLTGHWEMMGIVTKEPFKLFTNEGFPQSLKDSFEKETGEKVIWLKSYSGTEALYDYGEEAVKNKALIVYTSGDSVFQIAAHEDVFSLDRLYEICRIARKLCDLPEYHIGRVIARPFIGENRNTFKRVVGDRRDFSHTPTGETYMSLLKDAGYMTYCIGKIGDIFSRVGSTTDEHTTSNHDGMLKTLQQVKEGKWTGLCFTNLVEFDSEYGHRRNGVGYAKALEEFDQDLYQIVLAMHEDDLLIITGDHGNDPTYKGTDHTRERTPFLAYSKSINNGKGLPNRECFADLGASIGYNFGIEKKLNGTPVMELFED